MKTISSKFSLVVLIAVITACRQIPSGNSSFVFVEPPPKNAKELRIKESISILVGAKPLPPLQAPAYPRSALAARLGDIHMSVTVAVGKDGKVVSVEPSFADFAYTTQFKEEFQNAIQEAIAQWRFEPAYLARLDPRVNDAPIIVGIEEVETSFEVSFTFSRSGKVTSGVGEQKERSI